MQGERDKSVDRLTGSLREQLVRIPHVERLKEWEAGDTPPAVKITDAELEAMLAVPLNEAKRARLSSAADRVDVVDHQHVPVVPWV